MSPTRRRAMARCAAWHPAHAESFACRGLPAGAPRPRHGARQGRAPGAMLGRRVSRLAPPLLTRITHAHYPGGAMGTSRPTAITPAIYAPRAHRPYPVAVRRCGGARCLAAGPPGSRRRAIDAVRGLASRAPRPFARGGSPPIARGGSPPTARRGTYDGNTAGFRQ